MEFNQFIEIVNRMKAINPLWFALDADTVGTKADIETVEHQLNITLPEDYKKFVQKYGGGYFAFTVVFSVSPEGEWNITKQNRFLDLLEKQHFLAVADNQAGDYYGYKIENGLIRGKLFVYDHELRQISQTKYNDILEYITEVGLKQTI